MVPSTQMVADWSYTNSSSLCCKGELIQYSYTMLKVA